MITAACGRVLAGTNVTTFCPRLCNDCDIQPVAPSIDAVLADDEEGCLAALASITGQGCLNGAVCKWKKADCEDVNGTFTEPVCDCGGRGGEASSVGVCFWG